MRFLSRRAAIDSQKLADVVNRAPVDVDQAGVPLGAVFDQAREAREVDADAHAVAHVGRLVVDQPLARVQVGERLASSKAWPAPEADLGQARALAHQHRKGARADLGIERAVVAGLDASKRASGRRSRG